MTPLLKTVLKRAGQNRFLDSANILEKIDNDLQVFEISKIVGAIDDLTRDSAINGSDLIERSILPARKCWFELKSTEGQGRYGMLVTQICGPDGKPVTGNLALVSGNNSMDLGLVDYKGQSHVNLIEMTSNTESKWVGVWVSAILWLINQPKTVHITHKSSGTRTRRRPNASSWPPNTWKKVQLVIDNEIVDYVASGDCHGKRPYHFVRGHYRYKGQLWVHGYWRGNKELGTILKETECVSKQSSRPLPKEAVSVSDKMQQMAM